MKILVGDFETTVYTGQVNTEVWASALVEIGTEDVKIFNSIDETYEYLCDLNESVILYYHNLKFDGSFWLSYLLTQLEYKQAYIPLNDEGTNVEWMKTKEMPNNSFKYSISDMGQWYTITIKHNKRTIEIRDSLKLLPFSVKRIGESFKTKHKKLDMEYTGFRYAGCTITDEEKQYIANDVLVIKEALEIMFAEGHKKLTIGSCCLAEYRNIIGEDLYKSWHPDLYEIPLEPEHTYATAGDWIRKSYKGGWCYLVKGKEGQIKTNGTTADVNSLYPSMMSSESGNIFPVGEPTFWTGNYIPDEARYNSNTNKPNYYFVRIKTRFYLKPNMLPFIQIKGSFNYKGNECLTTSDIRHPITGEYFKFYLGADNQVKDTRVELTLTMTDFKLIQEHYDLVDCEIIDGCYFRAYCGIFDDYIEKYKKIKMESKGAKRELAKLFLNNLYGKMASSKDSSFKICYLKDDGSVGFQLVEAHDKQAGYIACGSAITSYARNFTIRCAQKNYYGVENRGFIYADTDSIHCDLQPDELKGLTVDDKKFCCWKLESQWDFAIFTRQKTYIEHITHENLQPVEPEYNVKCAGMPEKCKNLFIKSITDEPLDLRNIDNPTPEQVFLSEKRTITDFKQGLKIPGKLMPKRIRGGVLLVDTTYEMR